MSFSFPLRRIFDSLPVVLLAGTLGLAGCATLNFQDAQPDYRARYPVPAERVWEAVVKVFEDLPRGTVDANRRALETGWMEGYGERPFGPFGGGMMGGQWKRRLKILARVQPLDAAGSELRLVTRVEEKPPGGPRAYRWERVLSSGEMEKEIFTRVQKILAPPSGSSAP
jgi:hypothetical protein